jgi:hypothetical protein
MYGFLLFIRITDAGRNDRDLRERIMRITVLVSIAIALTVAGQAAMADPQARSHGNKPSENPLSDVARLQREYRTASYSPSMDSACWARRTTCSSVLWTRRDAER